MATVPVILVPRRVSDVHRERVWTWLKDQYRLLGWPIVEGHHNDGPFNRSAAVNLAAELAGPEWTVALVIDADTHVRPGQVEAAVAIAEKFGRLTFAFDVHRSLTPMGTATIMGGYRGSWGQFVKVDRPNTVSSCLAVPRALWQRVGGFDERFVGWGFEDRAFEVACDTLAPGTERVAGGAYHLWHPRPEGSHAGPLYEANLALGKRYRQARGNVAAIEALIAERNG